MATLDNGLSQPGLGSLAVSLTDYSLSYTGAASKPVHVLNGVNLSVRTGEVLAVVGPSGCGKTTLLRAVAGLLIKLDEVHVSGDLEVFGMSADAARLRRTFAVAFQNPVLLPWRTVRRNVALPLEILSGSREDRSEVVEDMLSLVGIREFAEFRTNQISGGMQQRASLARALVQNPRILLMDEPFSSLDEVTREQLNFKLLAIHRSRNTTIIFATHSLSEAVLLADRIVVMGARPSSVRAILNIDLPRHRNPETLSSPTYLSMVRQVRLAFAQEDATT